MKFITSTKELKSFCKKISKESFITVDTEFMRERTYYPKLCLIQVAGKTDHAIIDPLAEDIDLAPFDELLLNPNIRKVLHGCRQDIEIFYFRLGKVPENIFDTQIAAMVCGFQESISYEALVKKYTDGTLDKTHRFTDWSVRPLSDAQMVYAIADVTYLYEIYEKMISFIGHNGRMGWVEEEMDSMKNPMLYHTMPDDAWKRIKARSNKPRFLAVLREIAAWREELAQRKDIPRTRIFRDDVLLQIAATMPDTPEKLEKTRNISQGFSRSDEGKALLDAVIRGIKAKKSDCPDRADTKEYPSYINPIVELLRVLLKFKSDDCDVAPSMLANGDDLKKIAFEKNPQDCDDIPCMHGWRFDIFGRDAIALKNGELALSIVNGRLHLEVLSEPEPKQKKGKV